MDTCTITDIIFEKVCFSYGQKLTKIDIFNNFSCKIKKGKITSSIGTSGSGKTSSLKLISGGIILDKLKLILFYRFIYLILKKKYEKY